MIRDGLFAGHVFSMSTYVCALPAVQSLYLSQHVPLAGVALHHLQQGGAQLRQTTLHAVLFQASLTLVHLERD